MTAVGIGIRSPAQATFEATSRIEHADKVFSLVTDPLAQYWVFSLNRNTESLGVHYAVGKDRHETYREMVERITVAVRGGFRVCAVSYGHPGVAAFPFHEAIRILAAEGFNVEMLPGVSAEDALFADLGVDPTVGGCLSYEATDFLLRKRVMDPACNLVLWQAGLIAERGYKDVADTWNRDGLRVLAERLLEVYPEDHEAVIYETFLSVACEPAIRRVTLRNLGQAPFSPMATLFVPPLRVAPLDAAMVKRLAI